MIIWSLICLNLIWTMFGAKAAWTSFGQSIHGFRRFHFVSHSLPVPRFLEIACEGLYLQMPVVPSLGCPFAGPKRSSPVLGVPTYWEPNYEKDLPPPKLVDFDRKPTILKGCPAELANLFTARWCSPKEVLCFICFFSAQSAQQVKQLAMRWRVFCFLHRQRQEAQKCVRGVSDEDNRLLSYVLLGLLCFSRLL